MISIIESFEQNRLNRLQCRIEIGSKYREQSNNRALKVCNTKYSFDWDRAARIIKERFKYYPLLRAEAGLKECWEHTSVIIFSNGKPKNNIIECSSNWATPMLLLRYFSGQEVMEMKIGTEEVLTEIRIDCEIKVPILEQSRNIWDLKSLAILSI